MYKHLTHYELYYIWLHCVQNFVKDKITDVAQTLGKHRSTIYRAIEYINKNNWSLVRNQGNLRKRDRSKFNTITEKVKCYISEKLKIGWSPDIIGGRMKKDIGMKVSFKTIYRYIWQNKNDGGTLHKLSGLSHEKSIQININ